jgi:hypothetical protein
MAIARVLSRTVKAISNATTQAPAFHACRHGLDNDLLEGHVGNVFNSVLSMLTRDATNLALGVQIKERVLIEIACLCHVCGETRCRVCQYLESNESS